MMNKHDFFMESRIRIERRKAQIPYRKPLKTFLEIAEMLGINKIKLRILMGDPLAPKAQMKRQGGNGKNYYNADEFKKWYSTIPKEKNK